MKISSITPSHWHQIEQIQHAAFNDEFPESVEILKSKVSASPHTCFVYLDDNQQVIGYLISHPYHKNTMPKLHEYIHPIDSDHLHIHDLAITQAYRGQGLPKQLLNHLFQTVKKEQYHSVSLIAVQNAETFWEKHGFTPAVNFTPSTTYGNNATCMHRLL